MELETIIKIVQGAVGMFLNTLAWLVILRTKSLHNVTNYLLAYLAVVDCIFCCHLVWINVAAETYLPESLIGREIYCRMVRSGFIFVCTLYSSSYALCLVTYERYIGIVHPLHYPRMMSPKKVIMIIFVALGMSILFPSPRFFTWNFSNDTNSVNGCKRIYSSNKTLEDVLNLLFAYLLPILFMSWAYYKIQATLKKRAQEFQLHNVQGAALRLLQARQNVISMLKIVMGALVVLWTPASLYVAICLPDAMQEWCYIHYSVTLNFAFEIMYKMNSVINPIIYIFKHKKFRKGLQDMLCCCFGRPQRPNHIIWIPMNERNV